MSPRRHGENTGSGEFLVDVFEDELDRLPEKQDDKVPSMAGLEAEGCRAGAMACCAGSMALAALTAALLTAGAIHLSSRRSH